MKKMFAAIVGLLATTWLFGQNCCDLARPDAHAPITIMGDHLHKKGELMYGYHFHLMNMNHPKDPTGGHVHAGGATMNMQMHAGEIMFGLTNNLTAMGMVSYLFNSMSGVQTKQSSAKSIGDAQIGLMTNLLRTRLTASHFQIAVSLPTGNINHRIQTTSGNLRLPYAMQLGSGTVDLMPGITFLWQKTRWSGGFQSVETIRLGKNRLGYRFGHQAGATSWAARRIGRDLSLSGRASVHYQTKMLGQDPEIPNTFLIPEGVHFDLSFGINYRFGGSFLKGHRVGFEAEKPLFYTSNLDRQRSNWEVSGGWQKSKTIR
jgi:hypothetical protein